MVITMPIDLNKTVLKEETGLDLKPSKNKDYMFSMESMDGMTMEMSLKFSIGHSKFLAVYSLEDNGSSISFQKDADKDCSILYREFSLTKDVLDGDMFLAVCKAFIQSEKTYIDLMGEGGFECR